MGYFLGYILFIFCSFLIGNLLFFIVEKFVIVSFKKINEFFYKPPKLSKEEVNKIYKEASYFVHSKHRPWIYDDTFAEYLWICNELCMDKNYLKNNLTGIKK